MNEKDRPSRAQPGKKIVSKNNLFVVEGNKFEDRIDRVRS
jgi:hypothetical protein